MLTTDEDLGAYPSGAATSDDEELAAYVNRVRELVVLMCANPEGGHLGGSMSLVEILVALYFSVLRVDPARPDDPDRDIFVLSKGHGALAHYATLAVRGFIPESQLARYGSPDSSLTAHPNPAVPGVEMPTGSLGHGLALGVGFALDLSLSGSDRRCFVVLGDGELQEGSNWEAAMSASAQQLDRLVAIVDRNGLQITGSTEDTLPLEPLADRWRSFGWSVVEVDGHDLRQLRSALAAAPLEPGRPTAVLAATVKGKGLPYVEGQPRSHYAKLSVRQRQRALATLAGRSVLQGKAVMSASAAHRGGATTAREQPDAPATDRPSRATREVYRDLLVDLVRSDDRLICLDSDTGLFIQADWGEADDRYVNLGIAEQNLLGTAAALAKSGRIPFVNTMATFAATRALEAVKVDVALNNVPVRIAATHGGLSAGHLGPTHHSLEDLAVMRLLPNFTVLVPADATNTEELLRACVDLPGPVYLRLGRGPTPDLDLDRLPTPQIGRMQPLRDGDDVTLIATGPHPVLAALAAAEELAREGIGSAVLNAHTIKPLDQAALLRAAQGTRGIVTVEEHWAAGGLGSAVAEVVGRLGVATPVLPVAVDDTFAQGTGNHRHLIERNGITPEAVVERVRRLLDIRAGGTGRRSGCGVRPSC